MKQIILLLLLIIPAIPARSEQAGPKDFAYGLSLTVNSESPIYRCQLPQSVYLHTVRSDLRDMSVFNKQGESVPHILRSPEFFTQTPDPISLPFFPIYKESGKSGGFSFQLSGDGKGSILSIQTSAGDLTAGNVTAYILDTSTIDRQIHELELGWESSSDSFVTTVSIDYSNDLTNWIRMINAATLAKFLYGQHQLEQRRITLSGGKAKYLRMSWAAGKQGSQLFSVKALFSPITSEQNRMTSSLIGKPASDKPSVYQFDTQGFFPTDRINLILPQKNSIAQITLKSRANLSSEWKIRYQGVFYNLSVQGSVLNNSPIFLNSAITDRYWRLESDDNIGMGAGIPQLEISWIPHDLLFLARGEAPFQLAYGSSKIKASDTHIDKLFDSVKQYDLVQKASPGIEFELSGKDMLKPAPLPVPWKKFVLWTVLLIGVGVLGWMSLRLYRQMSKDSE